jgi:hypothetical protein
MAETTSERGNMGDIARREPNVPAPKAGTASRGGERAQSERLASEDVIINAPMSFAGAFQRTMRLRRIGGLNQQRWYVQVFWHWLVLNAILLFWWTAVICWYAIFGILLLPYRLLRRGARKRKADALRHREMLGAIEQR